MRKHSFSSQKYAIIKVMNTYKMMRRKKEDQREDSDSSNKL